MPSHSEQKQIKNEWCCPDDSEHKVIQWYIKQTLSNITSLWELECEQNKAQNNHIKLEA